MPDRNEPPFISATVEGRAPEPWPDVHARVLALVAELSAIPGIRARIDISVTVTMADD